MAKFENCIQLVLEHEQGLVKDHAGWTNWGITLGTLKRMGAKGLEDFAFCDIDGDGEIDADDIRALDRGKAKTFYRRYWWEPNRYNLITYDRVAEKILDLSVNMGPVQIGKLVQRTLNASGRVTKPLVVDGMIGPVTRRELNRIPRWVFMRGIRHTAAEFYEMLAMRNPDFGKYLDGWLNRAYD